MSTSCGNSPIAFEVFLHPFAARYPHELHVLQLDQASFHLTRSLTLPANIILLFQPAKSPELNPIERLWQHLKDHLAWGVFPNLDALRQVLDQRAVLSSPPTMSMPTSSQTPRSWRVTRASTALSPVFASSRTPCSWPRRCI